MADDLASTTHSHGVTLQHGRRIAKWLRALFPRPEHPR